MKKLALTFSFLTVANFANAQTESGQTVEKSVTGAQIGLFGLDLYNESRLADKFALRSELSLFPAIWGGDMYPKTGFAFYPGITLQPKYYYNIAKRAENGKNIKNNSANYFGLQVRYVPNWFVISNYDDIQNNSSLNFIPTYGFRRNFAENFNYEFRGGLGYGTTLGLDKNTSGLSLDLSFKIGYDF